jgi:phospholipid/cholesterol/gamma-HCH transport system ATP-binding protein
MALLSHGEPTAARDERTTAAPRAEEPVIVFDRVSLAFDEKVVLDQLSFELLPGRMKIILGASGAGKSILLKLILGLIRPDSGRIFVNGRRIDDMPETGLLGVRAHLGMVFQEGALFDSLTVRENVGYRLFEETDLPIADVDRRVQEVLGFVGLGEYSDRMPSELSGGQRRRVAIARALTAQPKILLYDEPTTGLDPITALTIDNEIIKLRDLEHVSSVIVTHQLRDAFFIATHEALTEGGSLTFVPASPATAGMTTFLMLKDGGIGFQGHIEELRSSKDEYLRAFLS